MFAAAKALLTRRQGGAVSTFVTRDPATGNLMLGGARFRFAGANAANDIGTVGSANGGAATPPAGYGGTVVSGSYITTHAQVDAYLASASAMKLGVIKATWSVHTVNHVDAVQPTLGVFNAAALDPICYAISQCAGNGIKFVLPLCEQPSSAQQWYIDQTGGGSGNDNFYLKAATIAAYKAHISYVLDFVNPYTGVALSQEPAVLCWQIGNEFTAPNISEAQYTTWADDIVNHIKVVKGAKQLVQDGHYGPYGLTSGCDIYDQHAYDQWRTPAFLIGQAQACHAAGKAYFVGEFDWHQGSLIKGAWNLDQQLDAWERSIYMDGSTFWDLLAPLTNWSDGYTLHYPGTSADMVTRGVMLSDHAQRMAGITPKTFLSDSFTGANGTALGSHVGEVGAVWDFNELWTAVSSIQNNRLCASSGESHYYSSGVPATADYIVGADIYTATALPNSFAGVTLRTETKTDYGYQAYILNVSGTPHIGLDYNNTTGYTTIATRAITAPVVGSTHRLELKVQGSSLTLYWDGVALGASVTHTSLVSAGRAGVILGGGSPTTGFHLENITATDL